MFQDLQSEFEGCLRSKFEFTKENIEIRLDSLRQDLELTKPYYVNQVLQVEKKISK